MKKCHPDSHVETCPLCNLYASNNAYRESLTAGKSCRRFIARERPRPLPIVHPDRCENFTGRTEFRAGCSGWKCEGGCTLGLPAVPGKYCQTCNDYAVDPDYEGRGIDGWLE